MLMFRDSRTDAHTLEQTERRTGQKYYEAVHTILGEGLNTTCTYD